MAYRSTLTNSNNTTNGDNPVNTVDTGDTGAQGVQGVQGRTGARGEKGPQGETGPQGFQGNPGANGPQGSKGERGVQGRKGSTGVLGPMGAQGTQGAQGNDGMQGDRGVQGTQGGRGILGYQGVQGPQGNQGNRGVGGPQGTRGCAGPQGSKGTQGAQGPQGARGSNGAQGTRGCAGDQGAQGSIGVQGPQGAKGAQGRRGYIGYRGDNGEVGFQGVVGRDGAVWYDGIRLEGYNTHLFRFDSAAGKFVCPELSSGVKQNNYLCIEEGALIRLWLDEAAYESISENGEILIDNVDTVLPIETTHYEAFYSDGVSILDVIDPEKNLNTMVEFTFHDGAWYYSGGSLGISEPELSHGINVIGLDAGDYHDGDVIPAGTLMEDVLRTLLTHTIDVHAVAPKLSLTVTVRDSNDDIIEGTNIEIGTPIKISVTTDFTDGKFVGDEGYDYEIDAGCELTGVEWTVNNVPVAGEEYTTIMESGTLIIQATAGYSESHARPLKNTGVESTAHIDEGSVLSSVVVLSGVEYGYYDNVTKITASSFDDPTKYPVKSQSDLGERGTVKMKFNLKNGRGTINKIESTDTKPSFALAIPADYRITQTKNSNGEDVIGSDWDADHAGTWFKQNTIEYHIDERYLNYNVWVILSTGVTEYKDIIISR